MCMLFFPISSEAQQTFHVRVGATGNSSGSDWCNAFTSLPSSLQRGATYYVAAGKFTTSYKFRDIENGGLITVKRATVEEHESDVCWEDSFDSVVDWARITFRTGDYVFDGVTGGGPGNWRSGHGYRFNQGTGTRILIGDKFGSSPPDVDNVTIKHIEIAGSGAACDPRGIDATASGSVKTNIHLSHLWIHDAALPLFFIRVDDSIVEFSVFERNRSTAECHSEGISYRSSDRNTFRYNIWSDIEGTAYFVLLTGPSDDTRIYGSIFMRPQNPQRGGVGNGTITTRTAGDAAPTNWKVYNNAFINHNTGNSNGVRFWVGASGNIVQNNIILDCTVNWGYNGVVTRTHNWYFNSGSFSETSIQNGTGDPFVDWVNDDFHLKAATNAGFTLSSPFDTDADGNSRGADGLWDRGAFEFTGNVTQLAPPQNLRVVTVK